jgi:hypothetical protein
MLDSHPCFCGKKKKKKKKLVLEPVKYGEIP